MLINPENRNQSIPANITQPVFEDGKEYVVNLHKDVDYDTFWNQMENETVALNHVPDRSIRIINERKPSLRSCHYCLTPEEAERLLNDPRVRSVEIPVKFRTDIVKTPHTTQVNNFSKPLNRSASTGDLVNWGLARTNQLDDNYTGLITTDNYDYTLTGKGVDIVVHDTGLEINHPEFQDENGVSRVREIDWYIDTGLVNPARIPINIKLSQRFLITSNSYLDFDAYVYSLPQSGAGLTSQAILGASLLLGAVHGCVQTFKTKTRNNDRMVHYSYYGGHTTSNTSIGGVSWEVKLFDNNWIEVLVLRHDDATNAAWRMYSNRQVAPVLDLTDFAVSSLEGPSATPVNFVLTTNDEGVTWEVVGAPSRPSHVELIDDEWTIVSGLSAPADDMELVLNQYLVDVNLQALNVPFDFLLFDTFYSPQPTNFYTDTEGHGTHVGGTIAGKTYGWAKNADIYLMKVSGLDGYEGGGIDEPDCFDVITHWHNNKPIDPATGVKRPTIVNMSWGYSFNYFAISLRGGRYRGVEWTYSSLDSNETEHGFPFGYSSIPSRNDSTDVAIEEMLDAGIHICIAAGNSSFKIDKPGGVDYDNLWYNGAQLTPYDLHRGSSPFSLRATMVGCIASTSQIDGKETVSDFSCVGPGVDVYAPGESIMSAMSTNNTLGDSYTSAPYFLDEEYKQSNLSGTSMASPQVCGLGALVLELNPGATVEELKQFIVNNSQNTLYTTGLDDDFDNGASVLGGPPNALYNKFNSPNSLKISKE